VLPTPTVGNATGTNERRGGARSDEKLLPGIVLDFLPTITASDADKARDNPAQANRKSPPISAVSQYFPTPNASDGTGGGQHPSKRVGHSRQLIDFVLLLTGEPTPPLFDVGNA
jgi:DNA (cytosine-5)-methyltransferase 1